MCVAAEFCFINTKAACHTVKESVEINMQAHDISKDVGFDLLGCNDV